LGGTTGRLDVELRRFIGKCWTCQEGEQANKRTSWQHGHLPALGESSTIFETAYSFDQNTTVTTYNQ
jgi:hypothetical protein